MKAVLLTLTVLCLLTNCFSQESEAKKIYYDTLRIHEPKMEEDDFATPEDYKNSIDLTGNDFTITINNKSHSQLSLQKLSLFIKNNRKYIVKNRISIVSDSKTAFQKLIDVLDVLTENKLEKYKVVSAYEDNPVKQPPIVIKTTTPPVAALDLNDSTVLKIFILKDSTIVSLLNKRYTYVSMVDLKKFFSESKNSIDPAKIAVVALGNSKYDQIEPVLSLLRELEYYKYHMIPVD